MSIGHWLNRQLEVWRPAMTEDGAGGWETQYALNGTVSGKVDQPTASERLLAQQGGSTHSHSVYLNPGADVERGDQLRGDGQVLEVLAVLEPSTPIYRKAECELTQRGG